jgi:hypothetical protein
MLSFYHSVDPFFNYLCYTCCFKVLINCTMTPPPPFLMIALLPQAFLHFTSAQMLNIKRVTPSHSFKTLNRQCSSFTLTMSVKGPLGLRTWVTYYAAAKPSVGLSPEGFISMVQCLGFWQHLGITMCHNMHMIQHHCLTFHDLQFHSYLITVLSAAYSPQYYLQIHIFTASTSGTSYVYKPLYL